MKPLAEIVNLNQISKGLTDRALTESGNPERQSEKVINYLFLSLSAKYGHKWASLFPDEDTIQVVRSEWARELESILPARLRYGLDRCVHEYPDWPPTIGQFIKLCEIKLVEAGLPSLDQAWQEICTEGKPFSHGVILAMKRDSQCDSFSWRLLQAQQAHKLFKPIYDRYIARAISGEALELPVMIENKVDKPVTWEERKRHAQKHLAELNKILGRPSPGACTCGD